ncbi:hypothetical protein SH580_11560 [Coraliomargarita algicola]|uniref:Type 4 fimbrial biogenesis protein PilX N-terminal domain-containing protein n=1 Tax=Coraliomargarita algicola TaxID=3092156 RepID=A0ABZ0RFT1_9BACT|nr:hypothetical protein [Coraliomargarita sp. J2-16]WPJ94071.1 hypothetical protein SH580_11560 [Coraliomargarita sp. J2-16]
MKPRNRLPNTQAQGGFALVIALTLMGFVLVLLVTITVLVNVETASSQTALTQLRAQESARLALMMALGDLQRYAGPDQRVTARAEILGNRLVDEDPHWTGVWDTTSPTATPHWLISGQNGSSQTNATLFEIVSSGTVTSSQDFVTVPSTQILSSNNTVSDRVGWWISGEASKASIQLVDNSQNLAEEFFTDYTSTGLSIEEQRQIRQQTSPRRHRTEMIHGTDSNFIPGEIEDINNASVSNKIDQSLSYLERIQSYSQLSILDGVSASEMSESFHDLTNISKALLTNTESGGLKRDLSDKTYNSSSSGLSIDSTVQEFLWSSLPSSNGDIPLKGLSETIVENLAAGDAINTTPPIITEFGLFFVVSGQSKSSTTARAFLRLEIEIWSPYGFRHNFEGASGSDTPELFVEFESLPDITLQFYDKDTETYTSSTILDFDDISPRFSLDMSETHKSGEIRKIIADWPINSSSNQSNFYYTDQWSWTITDPSYNSSHRNVSFPDGDSINYTSSSADITLTLTNTDGEILQRIDNIPVGDIVADFSYYEDSPSGLGSGDAPIVFSYKMKDTKYYLEKWLTEVDPRSIILDASESAIYDLLDVNDINGDGRSDADPLSAIYFDNLDLFHGQINNNFYRLFDLPATIPHSLGVLQHLQIKDTRPFSIGNAWGGDLNDLFDKFFISGIPNDPSATYWNPDIHEERDNLPNPFIEVSTIDNQSLSLTDLNNSESSKNLLIKGAFNINSTSIDAWSAMLAANSIYDWDYYVNKGTSSQVDSKRINLENAFFRLPNSGHMRSESYTEWKFPFEDYENETTLGDDYPRLEDGEKDLTYKNSNGYNPNSDWRPSLSLGHREYDIATISNLAAKIVENLKLHERPFISLKEFINSGILQTSIDQTAINTIEEGSNYDSAGDDVKMPINATSYLSQADIISALSPAMVTRSDTFRIRAIGQSVDPVTGEPIATAQCEVVVQRTTERFDGSSSQIMDNANGFGRKFKINDIKWLDSSQL